MKTPIYFSKVEYKEVIGRGNTSSIMLLNIPAKELSYQVFAWKRQMPGTEGLQKLECLGHTWTDRAAYPLKRIKSWKTGFEEQAIKDEPYEQEVVFSYAVKLTDEQMKELLPYCNALEFEPYIGKEMSMNDKGYRGYRDEVRLYFTAISDSYIPKMELPMDLYYDEEHIWPSEKLYRYLVKTYFEGNKKLKGWGPTYGGLSLFI